MPNTTVQVLNTGTGVIRTAATDASGEFVVTNLPLGTYQVSAEMKGFKKAVHPPVPITVKARVRVDMTLEVGEASQSIEVSGATALIKTDTAEVGGVVSRQVLQDVPIFGRNFLASRHWCQAPPTVPKPAANAISPALRSPSAALPPKPTTSSSTASRTIWSSPAPSPSFLRSTPSKSSPSRPASIRPNSAAPAVELSTLPSSPAPMTGMGSDTTTSATTNWMPAPTISPGPIRGKRRCAAISSAAAWDYR